MIRTRVDSSLEKQFVTAMVTSKPFLISVQSTIDPELYTAKYIKLLAGWCKDYFKQFNEPPGKTIESLFHAWVEKEQPDQEDAEAISDFLSGLSEAYDAAPVINAPFLAAEHTKFIRRKRMGLLADEIKTALTYGDDVAAAAHLAEYRDVPDTGLTGYNPMKGKSHYVQAFDRSSTCMMSLPTAAERFFRSVLVPGAFIGLQGNAKKKKTYFLYEFAYRALLAKLRVAFFQVGDLTKQDQDLRWAVRIAGQPIDPRDCAGVKYPIGLKLVDSGKVRMAEVAHEIKTFSAPLNPDSAYREIKAFNIRHKLSIEPPSIMFSVHPNGSININSIHSILKRWQHELNFTPDLVLVDYFDLLAPENIKLQKVDQIDETWRAGRRLSQEWNACVITPTQANREGYNSKTQKAHFATGNHLKNAHVTAMVGLNQTDEEISQGIMRLNWVFPPRNGHHDPKEILYVAQCLPLGAAMVRAAM